MCAPLLVLDLAVSACNTADDSVNSEGTCADADAGDDFADSGGTGAGDDFANSWSVDFSFSPAMKFLGDPSVFSICWALSGSWLLNLDVKRVVHTAKDASEISCQTSKEMLGLSKLSGTKKTAMAGIYMYSAVALAGKRGSTT